MFSIYFSPHFDAFSPQVVSSLVCRPDAICGGDEMLLLEATYTENIPGSSTSTGAGNEEFHPYKSDDDEDTNPTIRRVDSPLDEDMNDRRRTSARDEDKV